MRSVVVLPQPEGPSRVVKLPRGTASDTSSTAAWPAPAKCLVTPTSRTWASGSDMGDLLHPDAAASDGPDHGQYDDRHGDDRHGERSGAAPVEVVDELENGDRSHSRGRREQEDHHRERGDGSHEGRDEPCGEWSTQQREEHVTE